mgnify:CR=1 FL=1
MDNEPNGERNGLGPRPHLETIQTPSATLKLAVVYGRASLPYMNDGGMDRNARGRCDRRRRRTHPGAE